LLFVTRPGAGYSIDQNAFTFVLDRGK